MQFLTALRPSHPDISVLILFTTAVLAPRNSMVYHKPTPPGQWSGSGNNPPPTSSSSSNQKEVTHKWADIEAAFNAGKAAQNYGKGVHARSAATSSSSELPPLEVDSQEISVSKMFTAPPLAFAENTDEEQAQQFIASSTTEADANLEEPESNPAPQALFQYPDQEQQPHDSILQRHLLEADASVSALQIPDQSSEKPLDQLVATVLNAIEKSAATGHSSFESFFEQPKKTVSETREVQEDAPADEILANVSHTTCTDASLESTMNTNTLLDQNLTNESLLQPELEQNSAPQYAARVVNASLLKMIGNLAKDNAPPKDPSIASFPHFLQDPKFTRGGADDAQQSERREMQPRASQPEAHHSIGLALKKGDEVRDASQLGRVKIRLAETRCVDQHEQIPPRPIDPYPHVNKRHGEIQGKYQSLDCRLSRSLRPDGTSMEVRTASDYSSLTTIESGNSTSMVVHDRYRRPIFEHYTFEGGAWIFSEMNYADDGKIRPFPSEKLTVNSDGTVTSFFFSDMGHLKNRYDYPALLV